MLGSSTGAYGCSQQPLCLLQHAKLMEASGWRGKAIQYQIMQPKLRNSPPPKGRSSRRRKQCHLPCRAHAEAAADSVSAAPKPETLVLNVGGQEVRRAAHAE